MEKKKVLIVTYYWPPSGGSGVQRWLKFARYLPHFDMVPHIYTPLDPDFLVKDESLLGEVPAEAVVVRRKIIEPYALHRMFVGKKAAENSNVGMATSTKKGVRQKIANWIRSNVFIPDPRVLWVKPSVRFLASYLRTNKITTLITTGPPHSMHLIGLFLKREQGEKLTWIADFRDPWTNIDFFNELTLTKQSDKKHHQLEREVVGEADCVIVVGSTMGKELKELGARRVEVITNGYDDAAAGVTIEKDALFTISYIGLFSKTRNIVSLWQALLKFKTEITGEFRLRLVGTCDPVVRATIEKYGLSKQVEYIENVPHATAVGYQKASDLLLLLINDSPNAKGILTGKLFEYMSSEVAILAIGPTDGDVAAVLQETNAGTVFDFGDSQGIFTYLKESYEAFGRKEHPAASLAYQKYSRRNLTKSLVNLIRSLESTHTTP